MTRAFTERDQSAGSGLGGELLAGPKDLRSGSPAHGQVPREVIDHLTRVVLDTVNERGLAPPQYGQPQCVQSRAFDHTALVAQLALRVDYRHVEPSVVRPETRRPHDRADLAAPQVKLQPCRLGHAGRREAPWRAGLSLIPVRPGPLVERIQQARHPVDRAPETDAPTAS